MLSLGALSVSAAALAQRPVANTALVEADLEPEVQMMSVPPPCPNKPDLRVTKISTSTPLKTGHNLNQVQVTVINAG